MGSFAYIFLGSCKDIMIGPAAIMALFAQVGVESFGPPFATLLTHLTGCIVLICCIDLLQLGFLVDFISMPVTAGFTSAAAITFASGQVKGILGNQGKSNEFLEAYHKVFEHIGKTNLRDFFLCLTYIILLLAARKLKGGMSMDRVETALICLTSIGRNAIIVIIGTLVTHICYLNGATPFQLTGIMVHLALGFLTSRFYFIPKATLSALIICAGRWQECLQGDVLFSFNKSSEKSLKVGTVNKALNSYKPLKKHKTYARLKDWLQQCYNTKSLLPTPSVVKKQTADRSSLSNLTPTGNKQSSLTWQGALYNWGKFLRENSGKLMTLGLAAQLAAVQASGTHSTEKEFIPEGNLTDRFSMMPMLDINQTFPTLNTTPLSVGNGEISEELRQEILRQFGKVETDLQELIKALGANKSDESSEQISNETVFLLVIKSQDELPVDESPMCDVEQATLINFRKELQATLNGTNQAGYKNCPLNYNLDTCGELVKLILCGYNHLKDGYIQATGNGASLDEAIMWKNKLAEFEAKSKNKLDNMKRSFSQEHQREIEILKTTIQKLQQTVNLHIKTIQGEGSEVCAHRITNGYITRALEKFEQLKNEFGMIEEVIIRSIIKEVYRLERIDNIINFVKKLPSCNQCEISYSVLFDEMREKNHLNSPKVFIVFDAVKQCMHSSSQDNKLEPYARSVIDALATRIRNGNDYEQVIETLKEGCGQFLDDYWFKIIEKAYGSDLWAVKNILKFIRSLPCINQTARSLTALFNQMQNNNHLNSYQLLMLAYKIKQELDFVNKNPNFQYGPGGHQYYENKYRTLKYNLPESVRGIIWYGCSCTIRNNHYLEYLYPATEHHNYDSSRRTIYTWRPGNKFVESYWSFEPEDSAESFTIKSNYWNEYLYAAGSFAAYDSERRRVFTWIPKDKVTQGNWRLIPEGDTFLIFNTAHSEYLFANFINLWGNRRRVFTWRPYSIPDSVERKRKWQIDC